MKEIIFRAWHLSTKEMYDVGYINFKNHNVALTNMNHPELWTVFSCVILNQDTGLKDIKGKPIYEDDIVKFSIKGNKKDWKVCVVNYWEEGARFMFGDYDPIEIVDIEVIGSLYENPELLNN